MQHAYIQGWKIKRKEGVLASNAYPYFSGKQNISQKSVPIPNRHPLICLALESDHMATPNCQGGNWGCFWVASNNICCSSQSGYSSPGIHLAFVLLETRTCEPQTYNKGSATCFQASVLLTTCLGFYPLLWQDSWLLLSGDWLDRFPSPCPTALSKYPLYVQHLVGHSECPTPTLSSNTDARR